MTNDDPPEFQFKRLPVEDGEPLVDALEMALLRGDAAYIERHTSRLSCLISALSERANDLAALCVRAQKVRDRHEKAWHAPPVDKR
jgi:hypothetical protein